MIQKSGALFLRHICIGSTIGIALAMVGYVIGHLPYPYNGNSGNPTLMEVLFTGIELIVAVPWSLLDRPSEAYLPWFLILNGTIVGLLSGVIAINKIRLKPNHREHSGR